MTRPSSWVWSLPLEREGDGRFPAPTRRPLEDTVRLVLEVVPGERPLRPGFGWEAHGVPDLDTPVGRAVAAVQAENALARWAPDLAVDRVDVAGVSERHVDLVVTRRGRASRVRIRRRDARESTSERTTMGEPS